MKKKSTNNQAPIVAETSNNFPYLWVLAILLLAAISFSPMFQNGFTNWDDEGYVTKNPMWQEVAKGNWSSVFTENVMSNYHPLTMLSLAINYKMSGMNASSFHSTNLVFHLLNTLLVFLFIWHISGKKRITAAIVALLFAVHPMHVESVAWISERKDVLYTFFFLLGLLQYWKYLEGFNYKYLIISFLFFILSILSKPAAIVFPAVLLLLDYYKGRDFVVKNWLEKIPFFLVSLFFVFLTINIQSKTAIASEEKISLFSRIFFASYGVTEYLIRLFVPHHLSAIHEFPKGDLPSYYYLTMLGVVALLGAAYWYRQQRVVVFGIAFYLVNLMMVLQLVAIGNAVIAERYTYVPYIGLFFIIGYYADNELVSENWKKILTYGTLAASLVFAWLSFQQVKTWKNTETLWTQAITSYPNSCLALSNRALFYHDNQQEEKALKDLNISLAADSNHIKSLIFRTLVFVALNQFDKAKVDAERLVRLVPNDFNSYLMLGEAYNGLGEIDKAIENYGKVIALDANNSAALNNRGTLYFNKKKDYAKALEDFNQVLAITPKAATVQLNRSYCHYFLGDKVKALADAKIAQQLGAKPAADYMKVISE